MRRVPPDEGEEQDSVSQRSPLSMSSLRSISSRGAVRARETEREPEKVVGQTSMGNECGLIPSESIDGDTRVKRSSKAGCI